MRTPSDDLTEALFRPLTIGSLSLRNRIVMAPMTRAFADGGVPHDGFVEYYRRRAEGGVGLIVTQGAWIPDHAAGNNALVPRFHGVDALAGWRRVVDAAHEAGAKIVPQLWHVGNFVRAGEKRPAGLGGGPSGLTARPGERFEPMRAAEIDRVIAAFGDAAVSAQRLGFDGIELHGAHGYLIDQFFWERTNERSDHYGGNLVDRTRFAVEVVEEVRRRVGPDFPIILRFSQWKGQDYDGRLFRSAGELERWLEPLVAAGVDIFDCSTRRYWAPEFPGETLNLAGWTKKLSGKPTITVGAVGLDQEFTRRDVPVEVTSFDDLLERLERDEFELVAVGRSLIANPDWAQLVRTHAFEKIVPYERAQLDQLV